MTDRLTTPAVHRFITSPAGALFDTRPFETLKTRSLRRELGVARARAAADVSLGAGPAAFLRELGAPPAPDLHPRVERALARYAARREAHEDALERWEDAFWGDATATPDERVALERERRRSSERRAKPSRLFGFLADEHLLPPVKFDVPDPAAARERWDAALAAPSRLYDFETDLPTVERSRTVRGPGTVEYLVRFASPSPRFETATARVYEPEGASATVGSDAPTGRDSTAGESTPGRGLPTLVYNSGLAMLNDSLPYWPEEEYVARTLAPKGFRVILTDAPWHGRREVAGRYSGEPYLAGAPTSMFTLYAAAALENGALVDWARDLGAPVVGVGGVSLGGITTLHVAGRCGEWPASARPDLVFPVAAAGDVVTTLREGRLTPLLDIDDALDAAGWTADRLREFRPLLSPPRTPDVSPSRVFPFSGDADDLVVHRATDALYDAWTVPAENRTTWNAGHFGVLLCAMRDDEFARTVADRLGAFVDVPGPATTG